MDFLYIIIHIELIVVVLNYLIPNFVVQSSNNEVSLIKKMFLDRVVTVTDGDKVLLIFMYLFRNATQSNTVNFTLEDMIIDCGFYPKANKGGINDKFKVILILIQYYN